MWGHHVKERFPAERVCSRYRLLRARDSKASKIQPGVLDEKYYKIIKKICLNAQDEVVFSDGFDAANGTRFNGTSKKMCR